MRRGQGSSLVDRGKRMLFQPAQSALGCINLGRREAYAAVGGPQGIPHLWRAAWSWLRAVYA